MNGDETFISQQPPHRTGVGSVPHALSISGSSPVLKPKPLLKQHTTLGFSNLPFNESFDLSRRFECSVCLIAYRESGDGVPRSLMCGHTFCTGRL